LTIVGGFYREICRFPPSDEYWGSGGRAAAAIKELAISTKLVTAAESLAQPFLAAISQTVGFSFQSTPIPTTVVFRYDHGLSTPIISPPIHELERVHLKGCGDCVLQFGMLEADVDVTAKIIIYDPQNPLSPKHFHSTVRPDRLAYVLNATEAKRLGNNNDLMKAIAKVVKDSEADVIVIKRGPRGALIWQNEQITTIPAYQVENVWPIGSGDVFAAVFAAKWGIDGINAVDAARSASRATSDYVQTRSLPISREVIDEESALPIAQISDKHFEADTFDVYLAGPFFNMAQLWLIDEARAALAGMGLRVFSPYHDIGIGTALEVAPKDISALKKSRVVFAILDGVDPGTVFEVGFARAEQKPVIAFAQCTPEEPLKMVAGTGCEVVADFVSAIYKTAWAVWQ